jgi:hypothetical protein
MAEFWIQVCTGKKANQIIRNKQLNFLKKKSPKRNGTHCGT